MLRASSMLAPSLTSIGILLFWELPALCVFARAKDVRLAVMIPFCSTDYPKLSSTVTKAETDTLNVTFVKLDSCSEVDVIDELVNVFKNDVYDGVVGPGNTAICETAARLASHASRPMTSWSCVDDALTDKSVYSTLSRSVPSSANTARALSEILTRFRWKYVSIVFVTSQREMATDVHLQLTRDGSDITDFVQVSEDVTVDDVKAIFKRMQPDTRAVIMCLPDNVVAPVLIGARDADITSGSHAFFLLRTHKHLNVSANVTLQLDFTLQLDSLGGAYNVSQREEQLNEALGVLMVMEAHPQSLLNSTDQLDVFQYSAYNGNLYNAMMLMATTLYWRQGQTGGVTGGATNALAQNFTFQGLVGPTQTDGAGDVRLRFSLWDFRPDSGDFRLVLEVADTFDDIVTGGAILWPNGVGPKANDCEFDECDDDVQIAVIIAGAFVGVLVVGACVVTGILIKRHLNIKELERGPNKIVLHHDDLVFVTTKSFSKSIKSFKSNSMFDKPDLLKASEPQSQSLSSFSDPGDFSYSDTARYNGDLVYVKGLLIKGFEMKSKVRHYLRMMKDLRHENLNPFIGCFIDPLKPSLVWEYCSRKSLEDVIHNEDIKLDWDFKLSLLTDLVRGMRYLHSSTIRVHGNLKSGNCVIDSRFVLKLTDYGQAGIYEKCQTKRDLKSKELLWTAPELLRDPVEMMKGSQKGDVYSTSIIFQEVVVRGYPFCMLELDADEIIRKVRKPPPMCRPSVSQQAAPPQYIQLMKQCWAEMPDMRPDFESLHQQFKEMNKGKKQNIVDTMFKMLEKYSNDLEEIVRERTVQLEEEKKKTENLLSEMLPPSVAHSLLTGKPVEAESFEEVTIYFSDIVGFTTISAMSTPMQVVDLLNDLYTMFDATIDNHDVYKVETIGDAYMVVSGLPDKNGNRHAGEISTMALDLLSQCGQFKIRHMPEVPMQLRIGLHTGSCVSGVVGLRMPRYCLFGDTVNTASRMESTGAAHRIHVSEQTKIILDLLGGYHMQFRGEVELKGKGMARTFWLVGKDNFTKPLPVPPPLTGLQLPNTSNMKSQRDGPIKIKEAAVCSRPPTPNDTGSPIKHPAPPGDLAGSKSSSPVKNQQKVASPVKEQVGSRQSSPSKGQGKQNSPARRVIKSPPNGVLAKTNSSQFITDGGKNTSPHKSVETTTSQEQCKTNVDIHGSPRKAVAVNEPKTEHYSVDETKDNAPRELNSQSKELEHGKGQVKVQRHSNLSVATNASDKSQVSATKIHLEERDLRTSVPR